MNLFGTMERIRMALGRDPAEIGNELLQSVQRLNRPHCPASGRGEMFFGDCSTCVRRRLLMQSARKSRSTESDTSADPSMLARSMQALHNMGNGDYSSSEDWTPEPWPVPPSNVR
jgi:hypothetical protein